jgi:hypothetical protein
MKGRSRKAFLIFFVVAVAAFGSSQPEKPKEGQGYTRHQQLP